MNMEDFSVKRNVFIFFFPCEQRGKKTFPCPAIHEEKVNEVNVDEKSRPPNKQIDGCKTLRNFL